jgi:phosphonate transport system substrate-binding protein
MRALTRILMTATVALMALSPSSARAEEKEITELTFGIIPTDTLDNLKQGFEPLAADLGRKMGVKVKTQYGQDYAAVIEAMRFKKVDFAWFGNKSAIEAVDRANAEVFAQLVGLDGAPGYWSLIIVHKDSPYNSIDDIIKNGKDLVFGNGDPNSTSGNLIPAYYLWAKRGIDPNTLFKEVLNASHGANNLAVANKQVDFATNNTSAQRRFQKSNPELAKNIKIIWQSPLIPNDPICWRKDLPQEVKNKLKAAFLSYGRVGPEARQEQKILASVSSGWAPFNDSDNRQLVPIRQLNLVKDKKKLQAHPDLSAGEKAKRVAAIDAELEQLKSYYEMMQKY